MSIGNNSFLHGAGSNTSSFPVVTTSGSSGVGNVITTNIAEGWDVLSWQWYRKLPNGQLVVIVGATGSSYTQVPEDTITGTVVYPIASGITFNAPGISAPVNPGTVSVYGTPVLTGIVGTPYTEFTVTGSGGIPPYAYSLVYAPPGMTISATGVVSYPSPVQGNYNGIIARVTDSVNTVGSLPPFTLNISVPVSQLSISGAPTLSATVGTAYTPFTVTVSGGVQPYSYSIVNAPSGMSISTSGVVTYQNPVQGIYSNIIVRVTDNIGAFANLAPFTLTVSAVALPLSITGTPVTSSMIGISYPGFTATVLGGVPPYTYSLINAPVNMVINSSGVVTYPSQIQGSYPNIIVRATDNAGTAVQLNPFTLTVAAALSIIGTPVTTATVGTPYASFNVTASGGFTPYTYSLVNAPAGMSVSSIGHVSYSTPVLGTYPNIIVRVTDNNAYVANLQSFSLVVSAAVVNPPVNSIAPIITGTTQQGSILSVSNGTWTNSPTSYTRQWKRGGVAISGATSATYTLVALDVGTTITCTVIAINSGGSSSPITTAATTTITPLLDTRPKFGYAIANPTGVTFDFQTLLNGMTAMTGSSNGGRSGTFNTVASSTNYTWLAVLNSAAPNGITIFDGTGTGGFSGALSSGLFFGSDVDPIATSIEFTDSNGTVWDMYRSNGKASTFSTFTLS